MYTDFEAADDRDGRVFATMTDMPHFSIYNSMSLKPTDSEEHASYMVQFTGRVELSIDNNCPMTTSQDEEFAFAALPRLSDQEWDS